MSVWTVWSGAQTNLPLSWLHLPAERSAGFHVKHIQQRSQAGSGHPGKHTVYVPALSTVMCVSVTSCDEVSLCGISAALCDLFFNYHGSKRQPMNIMISTPRRARKRKHLLKRVDSIRPLRVEGEGETMRSGLVEKKASKEM